MTTLITGAGLVGSLVARRIVESGGPAPVLFDVAFSHENLRDHFDLDQVRMVRGDVTALSELFDAVQTYEVGRIVHTASFLTSTVNQRPVSGVHVNLGGMLTVLETARLTGLERVVFCSANTVTMGRVRADETDEDFSLRSVSEYPPTIYGTMKLASEWLGHNYADAFGVSVVSMRLGGVFGPWRGTPSGGPSRLVKTVVEQAWAGQPVRLSSADMAQSMDFVYARDVAKGLVLALEHPKPPSRVYNLSGGRLCSVAEVVDLLGQRLGRDVVVEHADEETSRGSYRPGPPIDISRATRELDFVPDFPIEKALDDYIEWLTRVTAEQGVQQ